MMTTLTGLTLEAAALVDRASAKCVAGLDLANTMIELCGPRDTPCVDFADREPFRFGPGHKVCSSFAQIVIVV